MNQELRIKEEKLQNAFHWIINILRKNKIPFLITGGFAAHLYGSRRAVNDIDIEVEREGFDKLVPFVREYATFGPDRYLDENFDVALMVTIDINGQEIDIGTGCKVFDIGSQDWKLVAGLDEYENREVFGMSVPVVTREKLKRIKTMLSRKQDLHDISLALNS